KVQDGTVNRVRMIPMVDAGAHYDHRSAFAVDGVLRKFSCNLCDQLRLYIRVFLLPGRSVGPVIFICCRCVTGYTAVDTGLGAHDIEYRGDEYRTCVCLYLPDRYIPLKDVIAGFLEQIGRASCRERVRIWVVWGSVRIQRGYGWRW